MTTPEDLDARLRRAAARHHDDVLATVDVAPALDASRRPSRRPIALAAVAAAVVALFAGVLVLQPEEEGDVDVAIDEDGLDDRAVEEDRPAPDFDNAPAPIGLGAPDDGKDSVRLPIVAEPATGLVDGQTVLVSGKGFPPDSSVGVVMCTKEAGQDHGARGVEACNINHYGSGMSDAQGVASVEFQVRRIVQFDGEDVDCASEPGRCIIGMGLISDYDQSGGVAVDFDPSLPLPEKPTVELTKTENLVDGETVRVSVTGVEPGAQIAMTQCSEDGACVEGPMLDDTVDQAGGYEGSIRLWRTFGAYGPNGPTNVDCAAVSCTLAVYTELASSWPLPEPSLTFDPSRGGRVPPTLRVVDTGPFGVRDDFRVEVAGAPAGHYAELQLCDLDSGSCAGWGSGEITGNPSVVEVSIEERGACTETCRLSAFLHRLDGRAQSGPPLLFPEPIPVPITG